MAIIIVDGCDAVIGATIEDKMKTFGPAGMARATLAALGWFLSQQ